MKRTILPMLLVALMATVANADSFTYDVNVDSLDSGVVSDETFALGAVNSIDSIEIDIAQTWGGDLEITLTAPDGTTYIPMFDEVDQGGSGNFDMGLAAGDGSLTNVDTFTFVESGGASVYDDTAGFVAGGVFNANTWGAGPHAAGNWNMLIVDDAGGDATSIGSVTVNFTAVPEPGSAALLMVGLGLFAARRRR